MRKRIQVILYAKPVVLLPPILDEFPKDIHIRAGGPAGVEGNLRPSRPIQPAMQVVDIALLKIDPETLDVALSGASASRQEKASSGRAGGFEYIASR
jgi:hypothetical protein